MGSPDPIPGRCGAKAKRGGFCSAFPLEGKRRCRMHGGPREGDPTNSLVHGKYSKHFRRISETAQAEIDDALQDPDLLDVRQPIALGRVLLNEAQLVPSEGMAMRLARRENARAISGMNLEGLTAEQLEQLLEPDEDDIEIARLALLSKSHQLVERHHKRQVDALRQIEVGRLMREALVPMFVEMGLRVGRLVEDFIEDPVKREKFRAAFRAEAKQVIVQITEMRDTKKSGRK